MKSPFILALWLSGGIAFAQTTNAPGSAVSINTSSVESVTAQWIWNSPGARQRCPAGEKVYFRQTINLPAFVDEAFLFVTADNEFTLFINGVGAGKDSKWEEPETIDIREFLLAGKNVIAVETVNAAIVGGEEKPSPAGLFLYACIRQKESKRFAQILDFATDKTWLCSTNKTKGWEDISFNHQNWSEAVELGDPTVGPWNLHGLGEKLTEALSRVGEKE